MDWSTGDPENLVGFEVQAFSIPEVPEDGDEGEFAVILSLMIWHHDLVYLEVKSEICLGNFN